MMKNLITYIKECISEYQNDKRHKILFEMANIQHSVKLGNNLCTISIHGADSKDREYPHIHIRLSNDNSGKQFNFEVSLVDILSDDEPILIRQTDRTGRKKIDIRNRARCSWDGYTKMRNDFEEWLEKPNHMPSFKNNLEALVYYYDFESQRNGSLLKYMSEHNRKVCSKYHYLFTDEDKQNYPECFD